MVKVIEKCQENTAFSSLPSEVISRVVSYMRQPDVLSLSQTSKFFNKVANEKLYRNLFLTDQSIMSSDSIGIGLDWTVLRVSYNQNHSAIKCLEWSFSRNSKLLGLIKEIVTTDITFLLFKLKFWAKFLIRNGFRFQSFKIFSIIQHIFVDQLDSFILNNHPLLKNLTSLQISNIKLLHTIIDDIEKVTKLSLIYHDFDSHFVELTETFINKLQTLNDLSILSSYQLGFKVLENIANSPHFQNQLNIDTLTFSHSHGQSRFNRFNIFSYDPIHATELSYSIFSKVFNLNNLKNLDLRIGCNYCYCTPRNIFLDNEPNCECLEKFFDGFIGNMNNLKKLSIVKSCDNVVYNPHSLIIFKENCAKLFSKTPNLTYLYLNFKSSLYPIFNTTRILPNLNDNSILDALGEYCPKLEILHLPDYIESFYIWTLSVKLNSDQIFTNCKCYHCSITRQKINGFLRYNEYISNFTGSNRNTIKFLIDFYNIVLNLLNNKKNLISQSDYSNSYLNLLNYPVENKKISLHQYFKHDDKEIMDLGFDEFMCGCKGNEFNLVITLLIHELTEKVDSFFITKFKNLKILNLNEIFLLIKKIDDYTFFEPIYDNFYDFTEPSKQNF